MRAENTPDREQANDLNNTTQSSNAGNVPNADLTTAKPETPSGEPATFTINNPDSYQRPRWLALVAGFGTGCGAYLVGLVLLALITTVTLGGTIPILQFIAALFIFPFVGVIVGSNIYNWVRNR